jgi:Zn-dependent protease with chaperone function
MDFFAAQDNALRQSKRLIWMFALAVLAIIIGVYVVVWFALSASSTNASPHPFFDPVLFAMVAVPVAALILGASAVKVSQYRKGGGAVAKALGGREVDRNTTDAAERRLVNVVEEMAIASGIPVPEIYVLDNEAGINAFASGYSPHDAAVAVTRGALHSFSRDELQGVVAHEFSHILNGDMRLNIRTAGVIFGVFLLSVIGFTLLRSAGRARLYSGRNSKGSGAVGVLLALGIAFYVLGSLGQLLGRLIQAAISRQREFLADASAVQFTRNPSGIADALQRIGANSQRGVIENEQAQGLAHFFFASALKKSMVGAFATHPPLEKRISAVDPSWDGSFKVRRSAAVTSPPASKPADEKSSAAANPMGRLAGVAMAGVLSADSLARARTLLDSLPPVLREAGRTPERAKSVVLALLMLDEEAAVQAAQRKRINDTFGPKSLESVDELLLFLKAQTAEKRLPILELVFPALDQLSESDRDQLVALVRELVAASGHMTSFEWCVLQMLRRHFELHFSRQSQPHSEVQSDDISAAKVLLHAVWFLDEVEQEAQASVWQKAWNGMPGEAGDPPAEAPDAVQLEKAIDQLAKSPFSFRRQLLSSAETLVRSNNSITGEEAEWLKALAFCLDCPAI